MGSDRAHKKHPRFTQISIHAPRMGSDSIWRTLSAGASNFNPRSPYGERLLDGRCVSALSDFNPRSPHGERPESCWRHYGRTVISIHAPRMGSDGQKLRLDLDVYVISIHAPRMGSDGFAKFPKPPIPISIHAPRMGSDLLRRA